MLIRQSTPDRPDMMHDLSSFIAMGNTQPGGFAGGLNLDGTAKWEPPPPPQPAEHKPAQQPLLGAGTLKLFHDFVEDAVRRNDEMSDETSTAAVPPPTGPQPWKLTPDMMNQKWGAVLKTLQPAASNVNRGGVPPLLARPRQAPAALGGKAFTPRDGGVTPRFTAPPMVTPRAPGIVRSRPVMQ